MQSLMGLNRAIAALTQQHAQHSPLYDVIISEVSLGSVLACLMCMLHSHTHSLASGNMWCCIAEAQYSHTDSMLSGGFGSTQEMQCV